MQNEPDLLFSVIIPVLNEEHYVGVLLESLTKQTCKKFEVIVVDANSTDKTAEVVAKYSQLLNLKFFQSPTKGVSGQRNYGASQSLADHLIFIDADCFVSTDFIANTVEAVTKYNQFSLYTAWVLPYKSNKIYKSFFYAFNLFRELVQTFHPVLLIGGFFIVRKSVFDNLHGFNESLKGGEDIDLAERAAKTGVNIKLLGRIKVYTSLRRFNKEGAFKQLKKLGQVGSQMLRGSLTEKDLDKIFDDYKMEGGTYYEHKENK